MPCIYCILKRHRLTHHTHHGSQEHLVPTLTPLPLLEYPQQKLRNNLQNTPLTFSNRRPPTPILQKFKNHVAPQQKLH